MIHNISIGKSLRFSIGEGFENMEVSINIEASMDEGRDQGMTDEAIIQDYTDMASSYVKTQREKHQSIISDKSVFFKGKPSANNN